MTSFLEQTYRRLRFGQPIVVVSGLPRSGTSMTMKMLEAGGMQILTDGVRTADESNPKGYYEFAPVMNLHQETDKRWLAQARGKALKIISFLLPDLPETNNYKVIFMHRNLHEVMASQAKMLDQRGEEKGEDDGRLFSSYQDQLKQTQQLLARRSCFDVLDVEYTSVLDSSATEADRIRSFVGGGLDATSMTAVVDHQLYRNRHEEGGG